MISYAVFEIAMSMRQFEGFSQVNKILDIYEKLVDTMHINTHIYFKNSHKQKFIKCMLSFTSAKVSILKRNW